MAVLGQFRTFEGTAICEFNVGELPAALLENPFVVKTTRGGE